MQKQIESTITQEISWKVVKEKYIFLTKFPRYVSERDILDIFSYFHVSETDISIGFDIFGRKTGNVVIKIFSEQDFKEILTCFKYYKFGNNLIEIKEANSSHFEISKKTKQFKEKPLKSTDKCFLKFKNLPLLTTEGNIRNLCMKYPIAEHGIQFLSNKQGNNLGEAIVAFFEPSDCEECLKEKNGEKITSQYISIEPSSLIEFEEYASSKSAFNTIKILSKCISPENVTKSLFINCLPLDIDYDFLLDFFSIFNFKKSNLLINDELLANNGCLIISFSNVQETEFGRKYLLSQKLNWNERTKQIQVENLLNLTMKSSINYL